MRSLKTDHRVLGEMLNQLTIQLGKPDLAWAFENLDLLWGSLAVHIRAENICLFPAILNAPRERFDANNKIPPYEQARTTIEQLRSEHNSFMSQLGQAMKELRAMIIHPESYSVEVTVPDIRNRIAVFADELHEHNKIEENQVYLWPALLLDQESLERLRVGVRSEIENLPSRFAWAS
jgi:iron-sulfur cluster repair protein YtfE (RIC family)